MARVVIGGSNEWREVAGDQEKSMGAKLTRTSRSVTRHFIIEGGYDKVNQFLNECKPPFRPPGQYPITGAFLFVDTVDVSPLSGVVRDGENKPTKTGEFPAYSAFKATVVYTPLPYQPKKEEGQQQNPLLGNTEITTSIGAEAMTLPGSGLYWSNNNGVRIGNETINAAIRLDTLNHQITKHHVVPLAIPWAKIREVNNTVNRGDFSSTHALWPGVKAETLLYTGAQISIRFSGDGTLENSITHVFVERSGVYGGEEITWSHLYDTSTNSFRKAFKDAAATKPVYERSPNSDFEALLT